MNTKYETVAEVIADRDALRAALQAIMDDYEDGRGYTHLDDELADMARAALAKTPNDQGKRTGKSASF